MSATDQISQLGATEQGKLGSALRPTLLFVAAFALNISPHEAAHALAGYVMGFSSTLFQMWVDPDAASATPLQLAVIATTGPIFSLIMGIVCLLIYGKVYRTRPSGLFFLMMAMVGIYSFLGPVAGVAFGGDFNIASNFLGAPKTILYSVSAVGFLLLSVFMFFIGRELSQWAPPDFERAKNVLCTTVAPWLIGTALAVLLYLPLPQFLVGSAVSGSAFWLVAVIGATFGYSRKRTTHSTASLTWIDFGLMIIAVALVRILAHGVRLSH